MSFLSWPPPDSFLRLLKNSVQFCKVYLVPILSVLLALNINWLIAPHLSVLPPFLTFLAAVMVTAWYGGFPSALFAIGLSAGVIDYYFIGRQYSFALNPGDTATIGLFLLEAIGMAYCIDYLRKNEVRLRQANTELQGQVAREQQRLAEKEDNLHGLTLQLAVTEERERRHLAAELHDYLAQLLVLARMKVKQTRQSLHGSHEQSDQFLSATEDLLGKSMDYVRTLMAELYPSQLNESGLPTSLRWLAGQMQRHGLDVEVFSQRDDLPLASDQAKSIYQSIRELLMNVVKHSGVSRAVVSLDVVGEQLLIKVRDTGRGFDPSLARARMPGQRFGLGSVHDRMLSIGGVFAVDSAEGRGTTVTLSFPMDQRSDALSLRVASSPPRDRVSTRRAARPDEESLPL